MSKLHSRKKGKSGSRRPKSAASAKHVEMPKEQIEELILKMVKEGTPEAKVGLILRDKHNVPSVKSVLGVSLSAFLKKRQSLPEYPDDLLNLIKKAMRVRNHLRIAKKDVHNKVKLLHIESKIHRLVKYYTNSGRLPVSWRYNPEQAALLVK
ncbi:30S ribosomal protein S15 [Candidatus Micrarchaeota archaeon]|nr:30S ribosomal protein S15 [Candidatus Micrarchaeota archaeon]